MPSLEEITARKRAERAAAGGTGFDAPGPTDIRKDEGGDSGGFGIGDIFGGAADTFRSVVPQSARDVAGDVINNTLSGERFVNTVGGAFGNGDLGTEISDRLREVDKIGGLLAVGFDVAASPASILTAGFGGQAAAALNAGRLGVAGRVAGAAIEPIAGGTAANAAGRFGQRFAAETILGTTAASVSQEVSERLEGANPVVAGITSLAAGALGGTTALRVAGRRAPGLVGRQIPVTQDLTIGADQLEGWRNDLRLDDIIPAQSADDVLENVGFTAKLRQKLSDQTAPGQQPGFVARLADKFLPRDGDAQALIGAAQVREQAHESWVALRMVDFDDNFSRMKDITTTDGNVSVTVRPDGSIDLPPDMRDAVENIRQTQDEMLAWERKQGLDPQEVIGERDAYPKLGIGQHEMTFAEMFERVTEGHYFPREVVEVNGIRQHKGRIDPFTVSKRAPGFADDVPEQIATLEANLAAGTEYGTNVRQVFEDRLISGGRRGNAQWFRDTASSKAFGGRTIGEYVDQHGFGIRQNVVQKQRNIQAQKLKLEKLITRKTAQGREVARAKKLRLQAKAASRQITRVEAQELRTLELVEKIRTQVIGNAVDAKTHRQAKSAVNRPAAKILKDTESGLERLTAAQTNLDKMSTLLDDAFEAKLLSESEIGSQKAQLARWRESLARDRGIVANLKEIGGQKLPGEVTVPGLGGRTFDEAVGRTLNNSLNPGTENAVIRQIGGFNNLARALMATMDLSAAGIQGLLVMGAHPIQAANALRVAWTSLAKPNVYADVLQSKKGLLENFIAKGGHFAADDTGEFAFSQAARKVPVLGKALDLSNMAFTRTGNLMRLTLFEQALETSKLGRLSNKGALRGGVTDAEAKRLVSTINSATGFHGGKPSSWEKIGLFAPRYFRSQLDVISKAMVRGGPDADYARMLLFRTAMMGSVLTIAANEARGESTEFNPLRENSRGELSFNSNFMRIKNVGGKDVSVFGGWDSMVGLMTTLAVQGPEPGISRLLRTKASPALSTVFDVIEGETFDGQQIDLTTPEGFANALLTETLNKTPFTAQDTLEGWRNGEWVPLGAAFNFFGVKSSPTTLYEQRDMLAQQMFDSHWTDLTGDEKAKIEEARPQLFADIQETDKDRAGNGDLSSKARLERDTIDQERIAEEAALGNAFQQGIIDIGDFTDRMDVLQASSSDQKRRIDSFLETEFGEPSNPNAKALSDWYDLSDLANIPGTKIRDWDKWEAIEHSFMQSLTPEQQRFIEERSRPDHAPEIDWYYKAKDVISTSGYYETVDEAFNLLSPSLGSLEAGQGINSYGDLLKVLDKAKATGDVQTVVQLDSIANAIQRTAGAQKELLRIGNPALDQALLTLGRVSKPLAIQ
jgi:hypothetical protein